MRSPLADGLKLQVVMELRFLFLIAAFPLHLYSNSESTPTYSLELNRVIILNLVQNPVRMKSLVQLYLH